MYTILLVIHTILVLFLIGIILLQRNDADGLGSLGGGGNNVLSGRAAGNLLTRTTAILATLFILTSLSLAILSSRMGHTSIVDQAGPDSVPIASVPVDTRKAPSTAPEPDAGLSAAPAARAPGEPSVPKPE